MHAPPPWPQFAALPGWFKYLPVLVKAMRDGPKKYIEDLYNSSEAISESHPSQIVTIVAKLCAEKKISPPPGLRSHPYFPGLAGAIGNKNAIIFSPITLSWPRNALKGLTAHETAHIVFGDEGVSARKTERRADRFSFFLTGDSTGFIEELRRVRQLEIGGLKGQGWMGNTVAFLKERSENKTHGSLDQRIHDLTEPLTSQEIAEFTKAIESYNARMAQERGKQALPAAPETLSAEVRSAAKEAVVSVDGDTIPSKTTPIDRPPDIKNPRRSNER